MAFMNLFFFFIFLFLSYYFITKDFRFSFESLPFFILRLVLEIILITVAVKAVAQADRSTYNFARLVTIPGVFAVDVLIGNALKPTELIGMLVIIVTLLAASLNHRVTKKGAHLAAISGLLAVITVSLYKHNITHYNSVEAEQMLMIGSLLIYFYVASIMITKEHPIRMLRQRMFFTQSLAHGFGAMLSSYAFIFAPASVTMATRRATAILWSIISGNMYFHERHIRAKIILFLFILCGLIFFVL